MKMNWKQLLNDKRPVKRKRGSDIRSEFEKDADRIFFSYPFRRLQNKTQVIPVPVYDFIHTRLTHSLEVATIGHSLGRTVAEGIGDKKGIIENYDLNKRRKEGEREITSYDFGAVVKAACLAHDLGNPPFGHSGEGSISDFFKNDDVYKTYGRYFIKISGYEKDKKNGLTDKQWEDLKTFEGNAMGFRIINNEHYHGFNLTYATLATFMKYPCESVIKDSINSIKNPPRKFLAYDKDKKKFFRASQKKFGFFQYEKNKFKQIAEKIGLLSLGNKNNLSYCRHPLAFLVEAADDVCYTLMDLEDSYRIGKIEEPFVHKNLVSIAGKEFTETKTYKDLNDDKEKIGYLRGKAIYKLVDEISRLFLEREEKMLTGEYDKELIKDKDFKYKNAWERITKRLKETVYKNYRPVQELEVVGSEILGGLLRLFIPTVQTPSPISINPTKSGLAHEKMLYLIIPHPPQYNKQLLKIIPKQYTLNDEEKERADNVYIKFIKVVEYVSGMTDTYALQLYRKLKGIDIPRLQNLDV